MTTLPGQLLATHVENRDHNAVFQLLQSGSVNLDERDSNGQTFLMLAAQVGDRKIAQSLCGQPNVDVNAVDNDNWSALLNAAKAGYQDIVALFLDHGAQVDHRDIGQWTSLMWACYKGHAATAVLLLNSSANPNVKGEHHMSCLTWAAGRGHSEIVRALIAHGAKINTADKYGTTPLIWASRKGYCGIVVMLLTAGANVDNAGMNSWTALLVAAKGGFENIVEALLEYNPNVNAVDKDGYTALSWGAKEGNMEIVRMLLTRGAYVNVPDRYGDSILIHAVKGGHLEVVKALLKKYVDVDMVGVDNKTSLYWAVEKGHVNIARLLLEYNANTEIATKDGDTPLLKAVRSRNYDLVKMLLEKHAKVSTADRRGDTPMHIAVRSRSKRIMELLLKNPKDGRLLYRPNRAGDTPYQLDMAHDKSILTQVFGTRNLNASDNMGGYELYSSTIADVLSEPSLHTPITVGLYAKWGSGKSFLIGKLVSEMEIFTKQQADPVFEFSVLQGAISVCISLLLALILWLAVWWPVGIAAFAGAMLLQYLFLGSLKLILAKRNWLWAYSVSTHIAKKLNVFKLLLKLLFCNEPIKINRDTSSVKFIFTKNARLASVAGEKSIVAMICTLCESLQDEYGLLVARLYRVFKPPKAEGRGYFKTVCCIPYFLITIVVLMCITASVIILSLVGIHSITNSRYAVPNGVLIAMGIIIGLTLLRYSITAARIILNVVVSPKQRVKNIGNRLDSLKMEGFMQSLKREVEIMGQLTSCMDAFTNTHTRLVIIVDGLDSCEQEKLLQVLDILNNLFGDVASPFITILAVDPHVIVKGIEQNLQGLFRDSSINGHDYLRNIVQLPFFLQQGQAPPKRYQSQQSRDRDLPFHKAESHISQTSASNVSLSADVKKGTHYKKTLGSVQLGSGHMLNRQPSQSDLSRSLGKNAYFSDVNPKNMKRLMNIIAVTGRLLRAHGIDFSWYKLAAWVTTTEQWPYRLSWMILEVEDQASECEDNMTLKTLYERVQPKIPTSREVDPLLEIDRNARKLELFLTNFTPVLTIADMKRFMPCTINVDPYLRKLITELQRNMENQASVDFLNPMLSPIPSEGGSIHPLVRSRNVSGDRGLSPSLRSTPGRAGGSYSSGTLPAYLPSNMISPAFMQMMGQTTPSPQPVDTKPKVKKAHGTRIKMQGGLPAERLSSLPLEGVCNVLTKLEGINKQLLHVYQTRIEDNNITGQVLTTCELPELKPVMQMTFGDWELFRTLVIMLRERDSAMANSGTSSSLDSLPEEIINSHRFKPVQNAYEDTDALQAPTPQYTQAQSIDRSTQDRPPRNITDIEDFKTATARRKDSTGPSKGLVQQDGGVAADPDMIEVTTPGGRMKRIDSMVTDVIHEANYLHQLMDAVGVGEDLSEGEEQQDVFIDMENVEPETSTKDTKGLIGKPKFKKKAKKKKQAELFTGQISYETDRSQSGYSVGPGEDSDTASEKEMAIIRRRDSLKSGTSWKSAASNTSKVNKTLPQTSNDGASAHGPLSHVSPSAHEPLSHVSPQAIEDIPLLTTANKKVECLKAGTEGRSDGRSSERRDSSLYLSSVEMTPTSSHEYLSLRKMSLKDDIAAPSAFKSITPGASQPNTRPSSRTSSKAGSVNMVPMNDMSHSERNAVRRQESAENILVSTDSIAPSDEVNV